MSRIFLPATKPECWKKFLADPKHWKTGYSAKALAYCWQEANGFPESVRSVFKKSGIELFQDIKLLLALPEYQVPLPGGARPSQNDIFVLARAKDQLVSITVEGKVSEPFGQTVAEWRKDGSAGKRERLSYLLQKLDLEKSTSIDEIRYQLLHRTVSALIEAKRFRAKSALMLVHSFSQSDEGLDDYGDFLALFNAKGSVNSISFGKNINGVNLYFGWVRGDKKYLSK